MLEKKDKQLRRRGQKKTLVKKKRTSMETYVHAWRWFAKRRKNPSEVRTFVHCTGSTAKHILPALVFDKPLVGRFPLVGRNLIGYLIVNLKLNPRAKRRYEMHSPGGYGVLDP